VTTTLRDGSEVADPRLGRLRQHDDRNLNFPVRALFGDTPPMPRSYTWSVGVHLDQGNLGACVGFSFAAELAARPVVVPDIDNTDGLRLYWRAQDLDQWPGYEYEGTSVLAGAKAVTEAGHYSEYRWAFSESQVALAVGYKGPVVIGVNWYSGMMRPDRNGYLNLTGQVEGGHAILVHSISVKRGDYVLWNSWGADWADNGRARLRRADMDRLLSEDGECCLPVRKALR
jgi:Papain family cysteine protease